MTAFEPRSIHTPADLAVIHSTPVVHSPATAPYRWVIGVVAHPNAGLAVAREWYAPDTRRFSMFSDRTYHATLERALSAFVEAVSGDYWAVAHLLRTPEAVEKRPKALKDTRAVGLATAMGVEI